MRYTEEEIWLPITDYSFGYFVSNFGRVMRVFTRRVGNHVIGVQRILRLQTNGRYSVVKPRKRWKRYYLHRLVAMKFIPVPERYEGMPLDRLEIDHIDGDISNNRADNLRWCLSSENANFPLHRQNLSIACKGHTPWNKGLVGVKGKAIRLLGDYDGIFDSPKKAATATGVPLYNVYASAHLRRSTADGLQFRYVER